MPRYINPPWWEEPNPFTDLRGTAPETPAAAAASAHFPGCHPDDAEAAEAPGVPDGYQPADTETCWHCRTPTPRGCSCAECCDASDYIPPSAIYHCRTCGRWWAWMTGLNVTQITFSPSPADVARAPGTDTAGQGMDEPGQAE